MPLLSVGAGFALASLPTPEGVLKKAQFYMNPFWECEALEEGSLC